MDLEETFEMRRKSYRARSRSIHIFDHSPVAEVHRSQHWVCRPRSNVVTEHIYTGIYRHISSLLLLSIMARFVSLSSLLLLLLVVSTTVQSLDVEIVGVTCDESLPVTADLKLKDCVAGSRCTFGQDATVYGSCTCLNYYHI